MGKKLDVNAAIAQCSVSFFFCSKYWIVHQKWRLSTQELSWVPTRGVSYLEVKKNRWLSSNWNSSNWADKCHTSLSCTVIELHSYYIILTCICKYTVHIAPLFKGIYGDLPPVTDQLYNIHPKKGLWLLDITNQIGCNQKEAHSSRT